MVPLKLVSNKDIMCRRVTVVAGAISHVSDALAWNYTLSGSMSTRTRRKRKFF